MMQTEQLATKNIRQLLLELAIPSIIAQLVNVAYNMVDRIYIGQLANGTKAMAALSVTLPIITFITAFTQLFGIGGAPIAAIRLGEGNKEEAERTMMNSFVLLLLGGFILTIIILLFQKPLLYMFGANKETIHLGSSYITIYALGTIFVMITLGMNAYINTQGNARMGMMTVLIGAILNIVLDPIFIFQFHMGVAGAALATIISQSVSCFWVMLFLLGSKSTLHLRKKYIHLKYKTSLAIMALGISPFTMSATESLLQISFNNTLKLYAGTIGVAAMAILVSLWQFIMLPLQGLCQGAQPIMSYNYGAKNYHRVKDTFKLCLGLCVGFGLVAQVIMMIFAKTFVSIFSSDPSTIHFTSWALRIYLMGAGLFGAQITCQQSFMALNQPKISLLMAITRKIILLIPMIYILPHVIGGTPFALNMSHSIASLVNNGGKTFSVLLAEPISDILAATITTTMFMRFYKKMD